MGIIDFIYAPIVMAFIYAGAINIRNRTMALDDPKRKYLLMGLHLKMIGTFGTAIIYWYYYGSGDTIWYHWRIEYLRHFFATNPDAALNFILKDPDQYSSIYPKAYRSLKAGDMSTFIVIKLGFFLSFPALKSYLAIAMMFSTIAYVGIWALFKKAVELFPDVKVKYLAYAILYVPSMFFWGSGLFKDTLTLGFTCLLIACFHELFMKRRRKLLNVILIFISAYMIGTIKSYILLALVPAILLWVTYTFKNKIKYSIVRTLITPVLIALSIPIGIIALQKMGTVFTKFNLENMQSKAEGMQRWHARRSSSGGSGYSLGHIEFTTAAMLKKAPAAINVTLFRPYMWETRNPVVLISAVESLIYLMVFLKLFLLSPFFTFRQLRKEPFLMFCLLFTLIFAFAVGFTSYNFGALVRYKIPCLPTFGIVLAVIYSRKKDAAKQKKLAREDVKISEISSDINESEIVQ